MLKSFADYIVFTLMGLVPGSRSGEALNFFIYDTLKIFLLLTIIIYVVAVIRTSFPPERTRRMLSHKREYVGNVLAALLGIVTPFCSCSAVPLFIGFVESGVPLGVTFSFLISSPMVNEVALIMLWGLFGWKIALIYIGIRSAGGDSCRHHHRQAEDGEVCPGLCLGDAGRQGRDRAADLP